MTKRLAIALVLLATWAGHTLLAQPSRPDFEAGSWYGSLDGARYVSVVTRAALEQSPRWRADDDSPPLVPRAAIRAATEAMQTLTSDISRWGVRDVRLTQVLLPDAWVYIVDFSPLPPRPQPTPEPPGLTGTLPAVTGGVAGSFVGTPMQIVVLMSGEAIVPRRATR